MFYIRYRPDDGEILGWGSGHYPDPIEGLKVVFSNPFTPDPMTQKYDIANLSVIEKTPDEQRAARLPKLVEVKAAIFGELTRTDRFLLPDYPHDAGRQDDWKQYRTMLRDLSKHWQDAREIIENCDVAPDGIDPMIGLRARL